MSWGSGDEKRAEEAAAGPLPGTLSIAFGVMLSLALFLSFKLLVDRTTTPVEALTGGGAKLPSSRPSSTAASSPPTAAPEEPTAVPAPPPPPASPEAIAAWIEGWRLAWQRGDIASYIDHYAAMFGSQGMDRTAWAEQKGAVFATGEADVAIGVSELAITSRPPIVIAAFIQDYRRGIYQDRGRKYLYLVAEQGEWRIFNEEWTKLEE